MLKENCYVSVDWLEFTLYAQSDNEEDIWSKFLFDFPEFDWNMRDTTLIASFGMGYNQCYAFNSDYFIFYNPDLHSNGIHVRIPAHGIYQVARMFGYDQEGDGYSEARGLVQLFRKKGAKFTRIDLAFDDYSKAFTPRDYMRFELEGRLSTKGKRCDFISGSVKGTRTGDTFYCGTRSSARFLRIYDKNAESLGEINAIRYELEFKRSAADQTAKKIVEYANCEDAFLNTLLDMIVVKEEYDKSGSETTIKKNKSLSPILEGWLLVFRNLCFTNNSDIIIKEQRKSSSYSSRMEFIKSLGKTIAMVRDVIGDVCFQDWLDAELLDIYRSNPKKKLMLDSMHYDSKFDRSVWDIFKV